MCLCEDAPTFVFMRHPVIKVYDTSSGTEVSEYPLEAFGGLAFHAKPALSLNSDFVCCAVLDQLLLSIARAEVASGGIERMVKDLSFVASKVQLSADTRYASAMGLGLCVYCIESGKGPSKRIDVATPPSDQTVEKSLLRSSKSLQNTLFSRDHNSLNCI